MNQKHLFTLRKILPSLLAFNWGTALAAPAIDSIRADASASSSRVIITGSGLCASRTCATLPTVKINGVDQPLLPGSTQTRLAVAWTPSAARAYVVEVINAKGADVLPVAIAIGATGPQGPKGDPGAMGAAGLPGAKGDRGDSGAVGPAGPQGLAGATGPQGLKGDTGPTGPQGMQGAKGDAGPVGALGLQGAKGDTGATGLAGPAGDQGLAGDVGQQGIQGDVGAVGPVGPQGLKGDNGLAGPAGSEGPKGDAGPQGARGDTGPASAYQQWVDVAGTSRQAEANSGYLALNDAAPVEITLPTTLSVGDVVQVSGIGRGGWKIRQNAGQTIYANFGIAAGQNWIARDPFGYWKSIASSADGSKLVAAGNGNRIYISADSGVSWTATGPTHNWTAVASSANGNMLVAATEEGGLHTSSDGGKTWVERGITSNASYELTRVWTSVASSASGLKLAAVELSGQAGDMNADGQLYTSNDGGATWIPRLFNQYWIAVASSADGNTLVAAGGRPYAPGTPPYDAGGYDRLYISDDGGANWTARESSRNWTSVTVSANGRILAAAEDGGRIYTSTDGGNTWIARGRSGHWRSLASSADGRKLVAVEAPGRIHISVDSGATWNAKAYDGYWYAATSSADGNKLVAAEVGSRIYTSSLSYWTSPGSGGFISGRQNEAIELQYWGNGQFGMLSHEGRLSAQ